MLFRYMLKWDRSRRNNILSFTNTHTCMQSQKLIHTCIHTLTHTHTNYLTNIDCCKCGNIFSFKNNSSDQTQPFTFRSKATSQNSYVHGFITDSRTVNWVTIKEAACFTYKSPVYYSVRTLVCTWSQSEVSAQEQRTVSSKSINHSIKTTDS